MSVENFKIEISQEYLMIYVRLARTRWPYEVLNTD
jgi:hypothetical protein